MQSGQPLQQQIRVHGNVTPVLRGQMQHRVLYRKTKMPEHVLTLVRVMQTHLNLWRINQQSVVPFVQLTALQKQITLIHIVLVQLGTAPTAR